MPPLPIISTNVYFPPITTDAGSGWYLRSRDRLSAGRSRSADRLAEASLTGRLPPETPPATMCLTLGIKSRILQRLGDHPPADGIRLPAEPIPEAEQGQVHLLLAHAPLSRLSELYPIVFEEILQEKTSTLPVKVR